MASTLSWTICQKLPPDPAESDQLDFTKQTFHQRQLSKLKLKLSWGSFPENISKTTEDRGILFLKHIYAPIVINPIFEPFRSKRSSKNKTIKIMATSVV